jgi:hypothetical protein
MTASTARPKSAWNPNLQSAHDPNIEDGGGVVHSGEDEAIAERSKRDAGIQRGYRKRHEERQAEEQRLLRR